jgi:hypothetical protein
MGAVLAAASIGIFFVPTVVLAWVAVAAVERRHPVGGSTA